MTDDAARPAKTALAPLAHRGHRPRERCSTAFHGDDDMGGPTMDGESPSSAGVRVPPRDILDHLVAELRVGARTPADILTQLRDAWDWDKASARQLRADINAAYDSGRVSDVEADDFDRGIDAWLATMADEDPTESVGGPAVAAVRRMRDAPAGPALEIRPGVVLGNRSVFDEAVAGGQSLRTRLECVTTQPLGWYEGLRIVTRCAAVLGQAHRQGFAHGDVQPGNVFLLAGGGVKVLDFGAANDAQPAPPVVALETESSSSAVTRTYASPEVLDGLAAEPRDDIFSLAVVAYEMLAGRHPFGRVPANEARARAMEVVPIQDLEPRQNAALASGLAWSRTNRPSSIEAWSDELSDRIPSVPADARLQTHRSTPAQWLPWRWVGAVAAIAALLFAVIWWVSRDQGTTAPVVVAVPEAKVSPLREEPLPAVGSPPPVDASRMPEPIVTALPVALPEASNEATIASTAPPVEVAPPARLPTDNRVRIETDPAIRISESAPAAVVVLRRSGSKAVPVTVKWRLQDGSGRDVEDFTTPAKRSTRIAAGQTTRAIYLPLVNDDRPESEEFFTLILQSPAGSIGKSNRVTITILDDD